MPMREACQLDKLWIWCPESRVGTWLWMGWLTLQSGVFWREIHGMKMLKGKGVQAAPLCLAQLLEAPGTGGRGVMRCSPTVEFSAWGFLPPKRSFLSLVFFLVSNRSLPGSVASS